MKKSKDSLIKIFIFIIGFLLFSAGMLISDKSNVGVFIGILGGAIMGSAQYVGKFFINKFKNKLS